MRGRKKLPRKDLITLIHIKELISYLGLLSQGYLHFNRKQKVLLDV